MTNSAFNIDSRIDIKLDYELAIRLGDFIISNIEKLRKMNPEILIDKQILALGYNLMNLEEEGEDNNFRHRKFQDQEIIKKTGQMYESIRSWKNQTISNP